MSWISAIFGRQTNKKNAAPTESNLQPNSPETISRLIEDLSSGDVLAAHNLSRNKDPGSFVRRKAERDLAQHIANPGVCVVSLHGPSKQGKSTIIRNVIGSGHTGISIEASSGISKADLYSRLLNAIGAEVEISKLVGSGVEASVGLAGIGTGIRGEHQRTTQKVIGNIEDADWVGDLLAKSTDTRLILIDSFHHIEEREQTALAKDFTLFGGKGFTVVAAGTWKQGNYLVERNGDLSGQHKHVSVDPWTNEELESVVLAGARELGVELSPQVVSALADKACGSVAALQLICQRYYLDQVAKDPAYQNSSALQKVNTAAQRVSAEHAEEMAMKLDTLSKWGAADETGRNLISFVTDAILDASPAEFVAGFKLNDLKSRTDASTRGWRKLAKGKPLYMDDKEFFVKLKSQWTAHQVKSNNTPIFVWDRTIERYVVNDAMLIFVHRTNRASLLSHFRSKIRQRLGY